jgi:hypothetical protein
MFAIKCRGVKAGKAHQTNRAGVELRVRSEELVTLIVVDSKQLLASAALGEVGTIPGIEVSRLWKTHHDWRHLIEPLPARDTWIADAE